MITSRECTSNLFIKRTLFLVLTFLGLSYIVSYTINFETLRFHNERKYKIDMIKELIENIDEDTELQIILDEISRYRMKRSKTKIPANEIVKFHSTDASTFKDLKIVENSSKTENKRNAVSAKIKIVAYFPRQIRLSHEIDMLNMSVCAASNCYVYRMSEESNSTISDADALVFQGNKMPKQLPSRRDYNKVFVFLNNEPPLYIQKTDLSKEMFVNYFNWTMTYRTDSDIPFLYGAIVHKDAHFEDYLNDKERNKRNELHLKKDLNKNYSAIYRAKDKNVFWIVSHCGTKSKREVYAMKMREHIDIDQFGRCNENKIGHQTYFSTEMWTHYKFYLAFENTYCVDYLTEKVYNWFETDVVLVVRGGSDYTKFLPNGTYVNADDFENAADLSNYLTKLGNNEKEYINMLKRKDEYRVYKEQQMVQSSFCHLCEKLNKVNDHIKSVENIYNWWQQDACWRITSPT